MELVYGAGRLDRCVPGIDELLRAWRDQERDLGQLYLMHELAVTTISLSAPRR